MRAGLMERRPVDLAMLVCGLAVTGIGVVLLLDSLDVYELDFGSLWPILLAAGGAILLALGLAGTRPPR
jgi:hypothetical protein